MVGTRRTPARPAPPEAYGQARRNAELARLRAAFEGRITAEIADGGPGELQWFALRVTPGHEWIAAAHLAARRFGIYLPTIDEMVHARGSWHFRQRPILPGYVFVCSIGLVGHWRRARACPGVTGFLTRAGTDQPAAIPPRFIEEVRAYEAEENARFEVIHGRSPGGSYTLAKKRSRKARRSHRIRRAQRAARDRSP